MFLQVGGKGLNDTWRYILGFFIIVMCWQVLGGLPVAGLFVYLVQQGEMVSRDIMKSASAAGVSRNITLTILLSSFAFGLLGLFFVNKLLHKRRFKLLITSRKRISWKRIIFSFTLWLFISVMLFMISYYQEPENYKFSFQPDKFIVLVIISLLLLPIQIGFEELFLRGYFMQGVAITTGSRLLALFLPAIIFGLLHGFNPEVSKYGFWLMMCYYIGTGIFLGIIAVMDEGLEVTLGFHFANNLLGTLFLRLEDSALQTDVLFVVKEYNPADDMVFFFGTLILFTVIIAKVFKWRNWTKLYTNNPKI